MMILKIPSILLYYLEPGLCLMDITPIPCPFIVLCTYKHFSPCSTTILFFSQLSSFFSHRPTQIQEGVCRKSHGRYSRFPSEYGQLPPECGQLITTPLGMRAVYLTCVFLVSSIIIVLFHLESYLPYFVIFPIFMCTYYVRILSLHTFILQPARPRAHGGLVIW